MTLFPPFLEVEFTPMPIVTALVLFFAGIGATGFFWWARREHQRLFDYTNNCMRILQGELLESEKKIDTLFTKNDEMTRDIVFIKEHVAGIHESVAWIKEYIKNDRRN